MPWDLDQTFGNGWDACVNDGTMNSTAYTVLGRDKACDDGYEFETALPAAAAEQAGNQDKVRRWQQLRSGPLSTENVCALLQHSSDELIRSGAQVREDVRWRCATATPRWRRFGIHDASAGSAGCLLCGAVTGGIVQPNNRNAANAEALAAFFAKFFCAQTGKIV